MTMAHLFNSRVSVSRLTQTATAGAPTYDWLPVPGLQALDCRLDVGFLRPGKDMPMPVEAGKAPPRIAVLYCSPTVPLWAGDQLQCITNRFGQIPVSGVWELRVPPDEAQDFSRQHHIEVQVVEVALAVAGQRIFPGGYN